MKATEMRGNGTDVRGMDARASMGSLLTMAILLASAFAMVGLMEGGEGNSAVEDLSGLDETTLVFTGAGTDTSAALTIEKRAVVSEAEFWVQGEQNSGGEYPADVVVDVGQDENTEWAFNGQGYGSLGRQGIFSDSASYKYLELDEGGFNTDNAIRLPKNATITESEFVIEGLSHDIRNGDFDDPPTMGWTLVTTANDGNDIYTRSTTRDASGDYPTAGWGSGDYLMLAGGGYPTSSDTNVDLEAHSDLFFASVSDHIRMDIFFNEESDRHDVDVSIHDELGNSFYVLDMDAQDSVTHVELDDQVVDISSGTGLTGKMRFIVLEHDGPSGWWGTRAAALCVDDIHLCDASGQSINTYPTDLKIDLGDDGGQPEYTNSYLSGIDTVTTLSSKIQNILGSPGGKTTVSMDAYGNEMVTIPVNVTVQSSVGWVNISSMDIEYSYKARVAVGEDGRTLAESLNELIPDTGEGTTKLTIGVTSSSAGQLWMGDVSITYNGAPKVGTIADQEVPEGACRPELLDLTAIFTDDGAEAPKFIVLTSEAGANPESQPIALDEVLSIDDDGHLALDLRGNNSQFNGDLSVVLRATDEGGLYTDSEPFTITVSPKNDEPYPYIDLPAVRMVEDGPAKKKDLTEFEYFRDPEGDELYYKAKVDPFDEYTKGDINVTASVSSGDVLKITSGGDWSGTGLKVYLFCDDDEDVNTTKDDPHQVITVNVTGTNDPPRMDPIEDLYLDEDGALEPWMDLADIVEDPESPDDELTYEIVLVSDSTLIDVGLTGSSISVSTAQPDTSGSSDVTLRVTDPEGAFTQDTFKVYVMSVNDPPVVADPVDRVTLDEDSNLKDALDLFDVFSDVEGPLSFTSAGSKNVGVSIDKASGMVAFSAATANWFGTEYITFYANDTVTRVGHQVEIVVEPVNDRPYWSQGLKPIIKPLEGSKDLELEVAFEASNATDVETPQDQLVYYWDVDDRVDSDGDGDPANDHDLANRSGVYEYPEYGDYEMTLMVFDGELYSKPKTVHIGIDEEYSKLGTIVNEPEDKRGEGDLPWYLILLVILIILSALAAYLYSKDRKKVEKLDAEMVEAVKDGEVVDEVKNKGRTVKAEPAAPAAKAKTGDVKTAGAKPAAPAGSPAAAGAPPKVEAKAPAAAGAAPKVEAKPAAPAEGKAAVKPAEGTMPPVKSPVRSPVKTPADGAVKQPVGTTPPAAPGAPPKPPA